jgi:hypothetical protein
MLLTMVFFVRKPKDFIKTRVKDSIKPSALVFRAGGRRVNPKVL